MILTQEQKVTLGDAASHAGADIVDGNDFEDLLVAHGQQAHNVVPRLPSDQVFLGKNEN